MSRGQWQVLTNRPLSDVLTSDALSSFKNILPCFASCTFTSSNTAKIIKTQNTQHSVWILHNADTHKSHTELQATPTWGLWLACFQSARSNFVQSTPIFSEASHFAAMCHLPDVHHIHLIRFFPISKLLVTPFLMTSLVVFSVFCHWFCFLTFYFFIISR